MIPRTSTFYRTDHGRQARRQLASELNFFLAEELVKRILQQVGEVP